MSGLGEEQTSAWVKKGMPGDDRRQLLFGRAEEHVSVQRYLQVKKHKSVPGWE